MVKLYLFWYYRQSRWVRVMIWYNCAILVTELLLVTLTFNPSSIALASLISLGTEMYSHWFVGGSITVNSQGLCGFDIDIQFVWKQILLFGGSFLEECMPYWHRFVKLNKILFEIVIRIFISPNVGRWRENCWDFSHRMRNVCGYDILAPMKHKKTLRSCGCHRIEWILNSPTSTDYRRID